ncbi:MULTISPECIES: endo-alpha-N-acetylgalactosaminidase family protein [Sphingobacterium]|uniref:endo-alpha-N-acetylgalactosaminidase family protein n=1 Tax=Sphingobacterium TaxID=28453 RepID=UPI00257AA4AE|nr:MULTISPECIES: endo-alpha-N-acetylgalactosaminidase family protein [Sphingobacterium]
MLLFSSSIRRENNYYIQLVLRLCFIAVFFVGHFDVLAQKYTIADITKYQKDYTKNIVDIKSEKGESKMFLFDAKSLFHKDFIIEFDVIPLNSDSKFGVIAHYQNPKDWVYIGCDSTSDILTHSLWNFRRSGLTKFIGKDITKFYKNFRRTVLMKFEQQIITVYLDGEKIIQQYIPQSEGKPGRLGFMAHNGGAVKIENISVRKLTAEKKDKIQVGATLANNELKVSFAAGYPAILNYQLTKGNVEIQGKKTFNNLFTVNGIDYIGNTKISQVNQRVVYHSIIPAIDVAFDTEFWLEKNKVHLKLHNIRESKGFKVKTLAFPNHDLVSVKHNIANAQLSIAHGLEIDEFLNLSELEVDPVSKTAAVAILNTNHMAVSLISNSAYNAEQIRYRTFNDENSKFTSLFAEEWIIRGIDGFRFPDPELTIVFSNDKNGDHRINWQDAAYELAKIFPKPYASESVRNAYATITMNFASGGQYPFLRQLDNIKKFYLATDGFPQLLEMKGYQSEGHDSGHPDYAGNYNKRAGGYEDLKEMIAVAKRYHAAIGVHINHSEAYPEAKAYSDSIMTDVPGWSWLDQAYLINKKQDILNGSFEKRIQRLKFDLPELAFVYLDTYREERAIATYTSALFNKMGWGIWTEEPNIFYNSAIWTHYVPDAKSTIARFILHQYRDGFAQHPLLLGGYDRGASIGFMGWQKGRDFNQVIRNFFTLQLPYRYMMHFPLKRINQEEALFENGVKSTLQYGQQQLERNGRLMKKGNTVFIPWDPIREEKIYFYSDTSNTLSWQLPESWKSQSEVFLYKLSARGKTFVNRVAVDKADHSVQLHSEAGQGYVLYKQFEDHQEDVHWGEGSIVVNPGFDGGLAGWETHKSPVQVLTLAYGQDVVKLRGNSHINQRIRLKKDVNYDVSVWVQVNGKGKATLSLNGHSTSIDESKVKNFFDNTDRFDTYFQRMKFSLKSQSENALLDLSFLNSDDSSSVYFDDVRIVERNGADPEPEPILIYSEDFENVDEGWGPFIPSKRSAFKTHLSERHEPYTKDNISGRYALKTWNEGNGEVYRTSPTIIQLQACQEYALSFDYLSTDDDAYQVVIRSTKDNREVLKEYLNGTKKFNKVFKTGDSADYYIAIVKLNKGTFLLDNFKLKSL